MNSSGHGLVQIKDGESFPSAFLLLSDTASKMPASQEEMKDAHAHTCMLGSSSGNKEFWLLPGTIVVQ